MIRREPVQTKTVIEPAEIINEDLDEVDRLRSEALRTPTVADDSLADDYEREAEDLTVTPPPPDSRITSKPISTVTKSKTTDDSYLESLLAGLDDWDNI
jgi:hypothetical protein